MWPQGLGGRLTVGCTREKSRPGRSHLGKGYSDDIRDRKGMWATVVSACIITRTGSFGTHTHSALIAVFLLFCGLDGFKSVCPVAVFGPVDFDEFHSTLLVHKIAH